MAELALQVENLTKVYGPRGLFRRGKSILAVDGMSFSVARGSIFGLLGPNGAGKTTLLKMLTTLVRPTSGRASVLGFDVVARPLEVRRRISAVLQETAVDQFLSVRGNLLSFARFHSLRGEIARSRASEVMERFGLTSEANRKVMDLSGGFRRRVQVAKVFMVDTPVLFLDEFSTGMDPILKREVMETFRAEARRGRTLVLTTQILNEAEELCDDILIMNHGRQVARGDMNALKQLSGGVYEITLTFDRVPEGAASEMSALHPLRSEIDQTTLKAALHASEAQVLEWVSSLSRRAKLLHAELSGASLEDIFIELTKKETKQ
ncbi:MAG TPA: ABC transporter ATP-binding protein [Candidatus Acidoferrales bacterium]|jgi:ABC-2 type transport system ATP-binding protein|nr:ABC transporter ATP-binding protein [Candidatus Acidoferrales bacterium]